jgi:hypothetical protein
MIAKRIAGANAYPGAPKGWKPPEHGECGHLAVRVVGGPNTMDMRCLSAWEPTPEELRLLNGGGHVILHIVGWQVPVALTVEAVAAEEEEESPT